MNHTLKRFGALMLTAMLLFGALMMPARASAEKLMEAYAKGGRIKTETEIVFNEKNIRQLLDMIVPGMMGEEGSVENKLLSTMLSALNKLRLTQIGGDKTSFLSLGTDQGELLNMHVSIAPEDAYILSSLLPGIEIKLPAEMLSAQMIRPEDLKALLESLSRYGAAAASYLMQSVLPSVTSESGSFEVEGSGLYTDRSGFALKSHQAAGLLEALLEVFRQDSALQAKLDEYFAAVTEAAGKVEGAPSAKLTSADIMAKLEEAIANIREEEDFKLANLTLYTAAGSENLRLEMEMLDGDAPTAFVSADVLEDGETIRLTLLALDGASEEGAIDWAALKKDILSGMNAQSALMSLMTLNVKDDEAANLETVKAAFEMHVMGLKLGIDGQTATQIEGEFRSDSNATLSVMGLPLLTAASKSAETQEEIPAPSRDGNRQIALSSGELSEEDASLLNEALNKALPELEQKLVTALPEEGPVLMELFKNMAEPGVSQPN